MGAYLKCNCNVILKIKKKTDYEISEQMFNFINYSNYYDSYAYFILNQIVTHLCVCVYVCVCVCVYTHTYIHTGCPGGNVPDVRRMFLKLKHTDITQNTYIRS